MRTSPVLAAFAAGCLIFVAAGPATAEKTPEPGGVGTSSITLLSLEAGGHQLQASTIGLVASTLEAGATGITYTPLTIDGEEKGRVHVPSNGAEVSVPATDSTAYAPSLAPLLRAQSPNVTAGTSETDEEARAGVHSDGLGGISILGTESGLKGTVTAGSHVKDAARAEKHLLVQDLELLSIEDLLTSLGIDTSKLPRETLLRLVDELELTETTIETALTELQAAEKTIQAQIDAAQGAVTEAEKQVLTENQAVKEATEALKKAEADAAAAGVSLLAAREALKDAEAAEAAARNTLAAAEAAAGSAVAAADAALKEIQAAADLLLIDVGQYLATFSGTPIVATYQNAVQQVQSTQGAVQSARTSVETLAAETRDALDDVSRAETLTGAAERVVQAARDALAAAQALLDTAQKLLTETTTNLSEIVRDIKPLEATLRARIKTVLDDTPLLTLDRLEVRTLAVASGAGDDEQETKIVGGEAEGLRVLGADVLQDALGKSQLDLSDLTQAEQDLIQGALGSVLGTLSEILSSVPGHPALDVPAPRVTLMDETEETGVEGGYGYAKSSLQALTITLPGVHVPAALLLPNAPELPALEDATATLDGLTSTGITLQIGALAEEARYLAAAAAPPVVVPPAAPPVVVPPAAPPVAVPPAAPPVVVPPAAPPAVRPQAPTKTPPRSTYTPPRPQAPVHTYTLAKTGSEKGAGALGFLLLAGALVLRRYGK